MKAKNISKRVLSVILCTVMLFSCWVFTAPSTNAAVAGPSSTFGDLGVHTGTSQPADNRGVGQYRVRLLYHEDDGFDKSLHDNKTYTAGLVYTTSTTSDGKRNLTGTSLSDDNGNYWCEYAKITYKTLNGTGSDGAVWFNLGDKDDHGRSDIVSGGGQDYGYFPSDDGVLINGFPTGFYTRFSDHSGKPWIGDNTAAYTIWLQIAVYDANGNYSWPQGTDTSTGFLGIGGWDNKYAGGIASGSVSKKNNDTTNLPLSKTVADSNYPVAQSTPAVSYSSSPITAPATSDAAATTNALSFTSPKDQWGSTMATSITTSCSNKATGISQSGKTTSVGYTANIDGDTDSQTVTATVKWPQKVTTSQKSKTASFTINDASYTVSFKNENGSATYTTSPSSFQYGHTPAYNGTTPTKTETPPVYAYTHDGWSSTVNGDKLTSLPAVTGASNKTFYAHFSKAKIPYTITYLKSDGTTYKVVENVDYGTVPADITGEGAVPAMITKEPDAANHYTSAWDNDINVPIEGNTTFRIVDTGTPHTLDEGVVTKEETCTETGILEKTCSVCNHHVQEVIPIDPNAHAWHRWKEERLDDLTPYVDVDKPYVPVVFECANGCGNFCSATYDSQTQKYNPTGVAGTYDSAASNTQEIPTPSFNDHEEELAPEYFYHYGNRLASLRVRLSEQESHSQAMRFSGDLDTSILANLGDYHFNVNPELIFNGDDLMSLAQIREKNAQDKGKTVADAYPDNTVIDFGFVFTQARYIRTAKTVINYDLMTLDNIGTNYRIYRMSVVENNLQNYRDGKTSIDEWKGVTTNEYNDRFTFNLVIDIKEQNYQAVYCARTYVIYKYQGDIVVVYDQPIIRFDEDTGEDVVRFSHDSVYNQAVKNLPINVDELDTPDLTPLQVYLKNKIYDYSGDVYFNDSKGEKKVNYTLLNPPQ